ncbi:MAG TPA: YbdD/YjiX family protein [Gemmatimonadales bacterium]|jgi:uncharacterized short protein YbdD (DUF466 family)|nr:YbdD/YjiX family protein [Gemmatimonadales bacterium]
MLISAIRRILGMPDYAAYCAHVRASHPGVPLPTEREYFDDYLKSRYEGGPTRCC